MNKISKKNKKNVKTCKKNVKTCKKKGKYGRFCKCFKRTKRNKRKYMKVKKLSLKKKMKRENKVKNYKGGNILTHTAAYYDKANPPGSFNPDLLDIPSVNIRVCGSSNLNKDISMIGRHSFSVDPTYTDLSRISPP